MTSIYFAWLVFVIIIDGTQFVYNTDFTASSCYSRIGGFSGAQIDYDSSTLLTTLFDGLAIAGDITVHGNDYFFLQISFTQPIDLHSAQLIWRPINARASITDSDSFTFTQISYYNLFTNTYDTLPVSQSQWDPIVADYVLFKANTNVLDLIFTNTIIFQLTFQNSSISEIHLTLATIAGEYYTWSPTDSPTNYPTKTPTQSPTKIPTKPPTKSPTYTPTQTPTKKPTQSPTFTIYDHKTDNFNFTHSLNVYPLSYRNETLFNFTVPGDKPYCLTCILSWSDIDASINVIGCDNNNIINNNIPNPFYSCDNGTWILQTSGTLADWQQTYGKIEIWEVDANDIEYLQYSFEYQWNISSCLWYNESSQVMEACPVLPLTNHIKNTAMFEFKMAKHYGDNRAAPLIVVWYDLLSIPYSIRPELNYKYHNLSLMDVGKGKEFGINELWHNFKNGIIAAGVLITSFIFIAIIACFVGEDKKNRKEFMLKTYNLRSAYRQSKENIILPKEKAQNKSKFIWKRHGPWLLIVLVARLIYMAVFTLSFFFLVFESINHEWFDVLSKYDEFADNRDDQLAIISSNIEAYYENETEKMHKEIEYRQKYCYTEYINKSTLEWNKGALSQYNNHSTQMYEKSQRVDLQKLNKTDSIYITGQTACDIMTQNGAYVLESDPMRKVFVFGNGTYKNTTYWFASDYDRNWDNFTDIEELLSERCLQQNWCAGWTWIDGINSTNFSNTTAHYYLLSSLSEPVNSELVGICYTVSRYDANSFDFSSHINSLKNRTDILRAEYLNEYQYEIESMSESLNGIWKALQSLGENNNNENEAASYTVIVNNDPNVQGHDIDIQLDEMIFSTSNQGDTTWKSSWYVIVTCPGCPDGKNFTSPHLQEVYDYIFGLNQSNITEYIKNGTHGPLPVNISNLVSVNPAIIKYPNLPTIAFPIKFNIPMHWPMIIGIGAALDVVLLIYRWYRTVGILARIIRGKDVEVALRYLTIEQKDKKCWKGRKITDKLLSVIMWIHDKCYYIRYNLFKLCYWLTVIFQLFVVAAVILMLYIIVDQILTVDFINELGTFILMTAGIAAQRAVRNQVLSTTALSYNNYTISNIEQTSHDFAQEKNEASWEWNIKELKRVDEWNGYFCSAWRAYQSTTRDISMDGEIISQYETLFDDNVNTSFNPNTNVEISIELPVIQYTNLHSSFWEISQIQIDWNFHINNTAGYSSAEQYIEFDIDTKLESASNWIQQTLQDNKYRAASYSKVNDIQSINMHLNETRFIKIKFSNSTDWSNAFEINEIKIYGSAPVNKIVCDKVQFYFWAFDASDISTPECPAITPVFGNMYRGFVRSWINNQLLKAHKPFILAIRNIALSPFFILFGAILGLIVVYVLGFIVEWLLIRFNLFRENMYSKVTLISTKWEEYDPELHYVTSTGVDTSDDDNYGPPNEDKDECGGIYMSPAEDRKNKYLHSSTPRDGYFSTPVKPTNMISPRVIELEQIILTSAKKVKEKLKRLASPKPYKRNGKSLLSPINKSHNAKELAQMLFNEKKRNQSTDIDSLEMRSDDADYGDNDRCKQQ